jgi:hypothetical protein
VALIRQVAPSRGFPGAVPCGVRTFLDSSIVLRNRDRPASLKTKVSYRLYSGESISPEKNSLFQIEEVYHPRKMTI